MTAHQLARNLLSGPDYPVYVNGWGSDEGLGPFEVSTVSVCESEKELFLSYDNE